MNFCEAMIKLESGSKVTRNNWRDGLYFQKNKDHVQSYQPNIEPYLYTENIMISDGWKIQGDENEYKFCEIIPFLQKGAKAKMKNWNEAYIFYDSETKGLVINKMVVFPYFPNFDDFLAQDWVEIL